MFLLKCFLVCHWLPVTSNNLTRFSVNLLNLVTLINLTKFSKAECIKHKVLFSSTKWHLPSMYIRVFKSHHPFFLKIADGDLRSDHFCCIFLTVISVKLAPKFILFNPRNIVTNPFLSYFYLMDLNYSMSNKWSVKCTTHYSENQYICHQAHPTCEFADLPKLVNLFYVNKTF